MNKPGCAHPTIERTKTAYRCADPECAQVVCELPVGGRYQHHTYKIARALILEPEGIGRDATPQELAEINRAMNRYLAASIAVPCTPIDGEGF